MLSTTKHWTPLLVYRLTACAAALVLYVDGVVIDATNNFEPYIFQWRWGAAIGAPLAFVALTFISSSARKYVGPCMFVVAMLVLTYSALVVYATDLGTDAALGSVVLLCGSAVMYHRVSLLVANLVGGVLIFLLAAGQVVVPEVSFAKYAVSVIAFASFFLVLMSVNLHLRSQTQMSEQAASVWFDHAADALIYGDVDKVSELRTNTTAQQLFETDDPSEIADAVLAGVLEAERDQDRTSILHEAATADEAEGVYKFTTASGHWFWGALSLRRVDLGGKESTLVRISDISARVAYEEGLKAAKLEAEAAMHARTRFLANMSHEIRTPMNGVIGMTSLVLDSELNDQQRGFIETIRASGESLLKIINEILDFSKIDANQVQLEERSFDLEACVAESMELIAAVADSKNIELILAMDANANTRYVGDENKVRQVLANLLSNAVKFTEQGFVKVSLDIEHAHNAVDTISIHVRDSGMGIPEHKIPTLFDPFTQADLSTTRKFGGTGLGLTISKGLAELMGGTIAVASQVSAGSCFTFSLQAERDAAAVNLERQDHDVDVIVHDGPEAMPVLVDTLTQLGYRVTPQPTATAAVDACRNNAAQMLVLGTHADVRYTVELGEQIKSLSAHVHTLLLGSGARIYATDFDTVLRKPVRPSTLRAALLRLRDISPTTGEASTADAAPVAAFETKLSVLLAEDNPVNQKVALLMLSRLGISADLAHNGRQAVEMQHANGYDFVLMDMQMPEIDGLEASQLIRQSESTAQPYIIAMTANAMSQDRENCFDAGMNDFLAKPVRLEDLHAVLNKALITRQSI